MLSIVYCLSPSISTTGEGPWRYSATFRPSNEYVDAVRLIFSIRSLSTSYVFEEDCLNHLFISFLIAVMYQMHIVTFISLIYKT